MRTESFGPTGQRLPVVGQGTWRMENDDRRQAIAQAIESAQEGDVVVIAGKGHEQGQEFENGRKEPFDDRSVAREALRRRAARIAGTLGSSR